MPRGRLLEASGFFALRTPALPFDEFERWGEGLEAPAAEGEALERALERDRARLRAGLRGWLDDPRVREALLVASPDLEKSLHEWLESPDGDRGRRVERSLVRFLTRMCTRPTPFGLFAGASTGRCGERTRFVLEGQAADRRHARLDMDYLHALGQALSRDPVLRARLILRPNSSLYRAAGRIHYVESRWDGRSRTHHLVVVEPTAHLDATLARAAGGAPRAALAAPLYAPDVSMEEAEAFVDALVESQILVTDLEPQVTGGEPLRGQVRILRGQADAEEAARPLERAQAALESLDATTPGRDVGRYAEALGALADLPARPDLPYLFQVDLIRSSPQATLGLEVLGEIARAVELLWRLAPPDPDPPLRRFREAFLERYEAREVPLVEALDEEIGIGFDPAPELRADPSPLLEGLEFPEPSPAGPRERDALLARILLGGAGGAGLPRTLDLGEEELRELSARDPEPLPDALAAVATVSARSTAALDAGEFEVLVEMAAGPSGARLLGRFCQADPALRAGVEAHLRAEEALRPGAIFAEVVHLPEGRLGNVLCRPVLRGHEIAFLGRSGAGEGRRIPLDDLLVSVEGERVVLRSRSLGREILPRLTSAHNYTWRSLGLYRFLCTLQEQGTASRLLWDWGALSGAPYLPRVRSGRAILSRARWRVTGAELRPLADRAGAPLIAVLRAWRAARVVPRLAVLADEDNRLLVDFENVLSVESFLQLVARREAFRLEEAAPGPSVLVARGPEGRFAHEIVVPFVRAREPETAPMRARWRRDGRRTGPAASPVRRFAPGSEWLYARLYCGRATADLVLREVVAPLLDQLGGGVTRWFFLRYGDPHWHVRLRLRGEPRFLLTEAGSRLESLAAPFLGDGRIWRLASDTYERELERYGGVAGIDLSERLFQADSDCALAIVRTLEGDEGLDARWRLALRGADLLLEDLRLAPEDRLRLVRGMRASLARELGADRDFERRLDQRYRDRREDVERLFDPGWEREGDLAPGLAILRERSSRLTALSGELLACARSGGLDSSLEELAASYVHLQCNRLLRSAHRAQEFVVYDFLARTYASRLARSGAPGR